MKKVAIITSGGDGAGVNAVIEMITRNTDIDLYGFNGGYDGILNNEPIFLCRTYCANCFLDSKHIIQTGRSKLPYTKEGREQLHRKLQADEYDFLIVCGGNGSQKAANLLNREGTKTIFIPMTVDNDVDGSDYTIGFDTALNHILEVISGLHDTASNMPGRIFMVEVLGGNAGNLALESAVAGACDLAIIPEFSTDHKKIAAYIQKKLQEKKSLIITCSESAYEEKNYQAGNQGVSFQISKTITEKTGIRVRNSIVGFYIRAGKPTFRDTQIASKMGAAVVRCITENVSGVMIGVKGDYIQSIPFEEVITMQNKLNPQMLEIAHLNKLIVQ